MHATTAPSELVRAPLPTEGAPGSAAAASDAPLLVDAPWLERHRGAVRVIDSRSVEARERSPLTGALTLPIEEQLSESTARPAIKQLAERVRDLLEQHGITPADHLVLVDGGDGSAALHAAMLELAGMRSVSVLLGTDVHSIGACDTSQVTDPGRWATAPPRTRVVAAFEDLVDAVVDGAATIIDVRSQLEHEGILGAPCCADRGAIPGSVHLEWSALLDISGTPHTDQRVREIASLVGIELDDPIIVTCHAGHRASIAGRILRSAGFTSVRISLGSWHEWSNRGLHDDGDAPHDVCPVTSAAGPSTAS